MGADRPSRGEKGSTVRIPHGMDKLLVVRGLRLARLASAPSLPGRKGQEPLQRGRLDVIPINSLKRSDSDDSLSGFHHVLSW